jgi:hypothetical protein
VRIVKRIRPPLPLPVELGGPEIAFRRAVDSYAFANKVSRAAVFRDIAAATGNSPNGLSLRYYQRGEEVWRFVGR